ncbi:hypothetical protein COV19_03670 [Candidatus Woesearchaeota archaeon CG10_big_fil_rev_8_21_14_0_10_44_13]|nr:MAG: hypothetical protein COV19_03670 [Candidatus Woesearchaeota archaeon CG10_big_fil_rev_8_21_14_0_10_44_13]
MAEQSVFRGGIDFFVKLGIYDVVLPFLLVFTIMFAILEKTKIFGTIKIGGEEYTKKNLNAMVGFIVGFIVIASSKLVGAINDSMGRVFLLLLISVCFLLLIGSFYHYDEKVLLEGGWRTFFMVAMLIGIILIFMDSIKLDSGESWLEWLWDFLKGNWAANYTASIILVIVLIGAILFITSDKKVKKEAKKD